MEENEVKMLAERLIPPPKSVRFDDGAEFHLRDGCRFVLRVAEPAGVREKAEKLCRKYWDVSAAVTV